MIKKIQVNQHALPTDAVPDVYKTVNLEQNEHNKSIKQFQHLDLNRLPSLKALLKELKAKELLDNLTYSMSKVMEIDDVGGKTEEMKKEIVIYVMQEIELFLLKPKSGSEKKQMAVQILQAMFYEDHILAGVIIDGLMPSLRQVGTLRRVCMKIFRYFQKKIGKRQLSANSD